MKNFNFNEFMNKAFGKEKDEQTHARVMLVIYFIFITILVILVRTSPNRNTNTNTDNKVKESTEIKEDTKTISPTPTPTPTSTSTTKKKQEHDVSYAYSYTINYDGVTEIYLGKRIDDKQKFSYTKDGKTVEYAIKDDEYLILENGKYHLTDRLDNYFKYCNVEKILSLLEDKLESSTETIFTITNKELAEIFDEKTINPDLENKIELELISGELKEIKLDLSNYESGINSLTIKMEFADIGKVEDFEIKMN